MFKLQVQFWTRKEKNGALLIEVQFWTRKKKNGALLIEVQFWTRKEKNGALLIEVTFWTRKEKNGTLLGFGINTESKDLRIIICLRKPKVSVERISVCNVAYTSAMLLYQ